MDSSLPYIQIFLSNNKKIFLFKKFWIIVLLFNKILWHYLQQEQENTLGKYKTRNHLACSRVKNWEILGRNITIIHKTLDVRFCTSEPKAISWDNKNNDWQKYYLADLMYCVCVVYTTRFTSKYENTSVDFYVQ